MISRLPQGEDKGKYAASYEMNHVSETVSTIDVVCYTNKELSAMARTSLS
jgi:hypothetical protein